MVTMAERLRNVEEMGEKMRSDVRDFGTKLENNTAQVIKLVNKFDELPKNFVPRNEYDLVIKIIGSVGLALLVAVVTLLFKVFTGGI
jgi:hypothetical protein